MCGPKFCSMKITQEIRDSVKNGLETKAAEFREVGDLYVEAPTPK
jgi:phosphomethylpyrimidine synthase